VVKSLEYKLQPQSKDNKFCQHNFMVKYLACRVSTLKPRLKSNQPRWTGFTGQGEDENAKLPKK
jgi:hypothetical protein